MQKPEAYMLDQRRLHLNHGPIDLIIGAFGKDKKRALVQAKLRFETVLSELVDELDQLRKPVSDYPYNGEISRQMATVCVPYTEVFVTPMASVAGAVADTVCQAMVAGCNLEKAYVNNGGDIAVFLAEGQSLTATIANAGVVGHVRMSAAKPSRGLATSGWRGRSHSLGIADAVTVVAGSAAQADVAATLIANAIDLQGHPGVLRKSAVSESPDSDLGERLVTVGVDPLSRDETQRALLSGNEFAENLPHRGLIDGAACFLNGQSTIIGVFPETGKANKSGGKNARLQIA